MKIFSPHRRKMEASRRFGGKEFQNKVKKAQGYKRIFDTRSRGVIGRFLHFVRLDRFSVFLPLVLVLGTSIYFLYVSEYFLLSEVKVRGNLQVNQEQIRNSLLNVEGGLIPRNHMLFLTKNKALDIISEAQPLVKDIVKYKRVWPNRIEVEIVERRPGFAFSANGKMYLIDEDGLAIKELNEPDGLIPVYDTVNETVSEGERLNNTKLVAFILSATKHWTVKINSQIKEIKVPGKAATQVQIISSEGWGVFFDINRPVEAQISSLSLILNRQIPAQNRLKLAYIDLRFDKWAYYCYRNEPCESQPQAVPDELTEEKIEVE
ncbi:MAG: FtsQ-type POTRA domain-containing protein [Candidatus Doudnabacteria bacterium]|nr:FtsQ-type POTRA domain-containing protein [Candidatus Doudnabacteria bacterium]